LKKKRKAVRGGIQKKRETKNIRGGGTGRRKGFARKKPRLEIKNGYCAKQWETRFGRKSHKKEVSITQKLGSQQVGILSSWQGAKEDHPRKSLERQMNN